MPPLARRLGLGRLLYFSWHWPRAKLAECRRAGGPLEQWRTTRGRRAMEIAARDLPPPPAAEGPPLELHVLTGRRFWFQTAFCLWSFARAARRSIVPVVYDDGSLRPEHCAPLAGLFPRIRFVPRNETRARLDVHLPVSRFPVLRERWQHYPNIRKLTDVHAGAAGWKLVLDSDLLFFRPPAVLLDWLRQPTRPLHAVDFETSYGYPRPWLEDLAGGPVAERVNVGLVGLRSDALDWERLEHWCRTLIERAGTHYYLEQALVAMLLSGRECTVAPAEDYVTLPRPPEARDCRAIMHHYVAGSKRWYFQHNWRRLLAAP